MNRLQRCHSIADLRQLARKKLPTAVFDYMDGGADDEYSLHHNTKAFSHYQLLPKILQDTTGVSLKTKLLGIDIDMPFICSPTAMSRLFHHQGETAVAKAVNEHNIFYALSTLSNVSIADIAQVNKGPKIFQMYLLKDENLNDELLQHCRDYQYDAVCLTVDTVILGNRERDIRNGMTVPPSLTIKNLLNFACHPRWCWHYLFGKTFELANLSHRISEGSSRDIVTLSQYVHAQLESRLSWQRAADLAARWGGKFIIKGVLSPEDAHRAVELGANAIIVSNHGGRQMDSTPAPIDMLPAIREKVGDAIEIILDGGIRRGSDIMKAVAMGANACSSGRCYLWGLAAGGEQGVKRALDILREELLRNMMLCGRSSISELDSQAIFAQP